MFERIEIKLSEETVARLRGLFYFPPVKVKLRVIGGRKTMDPMPSIADKN